MFSLSLIKEISRQLQPEQHSTCRNPDQRLIQTLNLNVTSTDVAIGELERAQHQIDALGLHERQDYGVRTTEMWIKALEIYTIRA